MQGRSMTLAYFSRNDIVKSSRVLFTWALYRKTCLMCIISQLQIPKNLNTRHGRDSGSNLWLMLSSMALSDGTLWRNSSWWNSWNSYAKIVQNKNPLKRLCIFPNTKTWQHPNPCHKYSKYSCSALRVDRYHYLSEALSYFRPFFAFSLQFSFVE